MPSISPAQWAGEVCLALGLGPMPADVPSGLGWSWGCRRKAGREQDREVGGALWEQERSRGHLPCSLRLRELLGSQVWSPTL